jgi:mono/diheme cytochrome c family protein
MKSVSIRKALFVAAATVALAVLAAVAVIEWRWTRRFDAPYPVVASSQDPATLARGEYIVYAAGACAYCHVPREAWPALDRGERLPLTGHHVFPLPFGDIYSANLTPDRETGIGTRTDGELARVLRFGVRADGRAAVPLMEIHLRDDDLAAVLAYLKSRPAVSHLVPEHALSLFGKALMAFAISPAAVETPRGPSPEGATVERGEYLANHVSSCVTCHTDRGEDGALVGPAFAGGQRMDVAADPTRVYVTPNLTPDHETSPVGQWPEDAFVARFRMGPQVEGSPMPWGAFARMSDDDLRALYRYLRSLPPTRNRVGPAIQPKVRPSVVS